MEILGIDIGGSGIKGARVDVQTGEMLSDRERISTPQPATPDAVGDAVAEIAQHFEWEGLIGCALPARVKRGIAMTAANIDDGWIGTDAEKLISKKTGCPTIALNDADAAGVAEMTFGAGKGREDLVLLLTFGTGIGSALFNDGRLVPNTEFGHVILPGQDKGKDAEDYAADSARKNDDLSWKKWAKRVQEYLEHIEFILSPDLIIIGGGVSRPKKYDKYLDLLSTEAELMPAQLQNEAGIIGAACRARTLIGKLIRER